MPPDVRDLVIDFVRSWEKKAIIDFHYQYPLEGYRRLTFMMLDKDIVVVSPSSTYRVLSDAGLLKKWNNKPTKKGTGFEQPLRTHEHWHIDVSHIIITILSCYRPEAVSQLPAECEKARSTALQKRWHM